MGKPSILYLKFLFLVCTAINKTTTSILPDYSKIHTSTEGGEKDFKKQGSSNGALIIPHKFS